MAEPSIASAPAPATIHHINPKKRLWDWLKDNSSHTPKEAAIALRMDEESAAHCCSQMFNRNMLTRIKRQTGDKGRTFEYSTPEGMEIYDLLPKTKKPIVRGPDLSRVVTTPPVPKRPQYRNMPALEALALYKAVRPMFTGELFAPVAEVA